MAHKEKSGAKPLLFLACQYPLVCQKHIHRFSKWHVVILAKSVFLSLSIHATGLPIRDNIHPAITDHLRQTCTHGGGCCTKLSCEPSREGAQIGITQLLGNASQ